MKEKILYTLRMIVRDELQAEETTIDDATYINQRSLINALFASGEFSVGSIILRLTVIDSLYSTNAAYSYFSFDEMSQRIYAIGDGKATQAERQRAERDYFYSVALTGKDPLGLFSEPYGFQKNLSEGSKQMSLLSKYAYYELMQERERYPIGFPIYDRLAKEAYPTVRKMLGEKDFYSMPSLETPTITQYVACLTQLRKGLFDNDKLFDGYQQFDILDAYLWRMGKFSDGNMSLLLERKDYARFIINLGMAAPLEKGKTTRKENADYTRRLQAEYDRYYPPRDGKNSKLDFNRLVLAHLLNDKNPFGGTSTCDYMTRLLAHWREFNTYKERAPKRGIPFPKFLSNK